MKKYITVFVLLLSLGVSAQHKHHKISGKVQAVINDKNTPLQGAYVQWMDSEGGVYTDAAGNFTIEHHHQAPYLIVQFVSFLPDTIHVLDLKKFYTITLEGATQLNTVNIIGKRLSNGLLKLDPRTTVLLTERAFQKAACCNLSESFTNSPAIDASFSDAVTGTKQIKMLGLDGFYTLIGREYMPSVRTLNAYYGLSHIPASWVDAIQITKGAGSVVNGYESIAGQINIEMKKPFGKDNFLLDQFVSNGGRAETDFIYRKDINEHIATSVLARYGIRNKRNDRNADGFLDMPISEDIKVMNRWQFASDNGFEGMLNASYHINDQQAGQVNYVEGSPTAYGIEIESKIFDAYGKLGKAFIDKEFKSFGSQWSYNNSQQTSYYGSESSGKTYEANSEQFYVNLLYENIIGNSFHQYQTGVSLLSDNIIEKYDGYEFSRIETVPGAFIEYTYKPKETFSLVGGIRADYNSIYGFSVTPRFHSKYRFNKEKTALRTSAGIGRRTSNPLAQNQQLFASGRTFNFIFSDSSLPFGLEQEVAFNTGLSLEHNLKLGYMPAIIGLDYFYSQFQNEVVLDRQTDGVARFYNMENGTRAHSFQAQLDLEPARRTDIRLAYRMFDVKTKYLAGRYQKPLISKHRSFIHMSQATRKDWDFSTTATWYGTQRIPGFVGEVIGPGGGLFLESRSPSFALINLHISKTIKKQFTLYIGAENILNYKQENPIQEAANPFDSNFDAGLVWGPVFGRMVYGGFRWRIKGEKK